MGSRAERKQRRLDKIGAYKEQINKAYMDYMVELARKCIAEGDRDANEGEIHQANMVQRNKVIELVKAYPQEKELIVTANNEYVNESIEKYKKV